MSKNITDTMLEKGAIYDEYNTIVCTCESGDKKIVSYENSRITLEDNFNRNCLICKSDLLYVCGLIDSRIRNDESNTAKDNIVQVCIIDTDLNFDSRMNMYKSYSYKSKEEEE